MMTDVVTSYRPVVDSEDVGICAHEISNGSIVSGARSGLRSVGLWKITEDIRTGGATTNSSVEQHGAIRVSRRAARHTGCSRR